MAQYLNGLVAEGIITPEEKDALMAAAGAADETQF
jgi:hypothetical protein